MALVDGKQVKVHYIQNVFRDEPDFGVTSINFNIKKLITKTILERTIEIK